MNRREPTPATNDAGTKRTLSGFARRLCAEWKHLNLPARDERIVVAVSGGADSTALLLAFDELLRGGRLSLKLKVAHLDHGLRGETGAADARWVEALASELGYEVSVERANVAEQSSAARDNLEQAARRARYEFLGRAAREWGARAVVVAHTLDDQAETMLLALMRGSGARGLGGMRPVRALDEQRKAQTDVPAEARLDVQVDARSNEDRNEVLLVRPLLDWARRRETVEYCELQQVAARMDAMNADERFSRVRVRRRLLPLMETFNPRAVEALGRTARLLRAEATALETLGEALLVEAMRDARLKLTAHSGQGGGMGKRRESTAADDASDDARDDVGDDVESDACESVIVDDAFENRLALSVSVLRGADEALVRCALRRWIASVCGNLRRVEAVHVAAVEKLLEGERGGRVAELPGGNRVERRRGRLVFHPKRPA